MYLSVVTSAMIELTTAPNTGTPPPKMVKSGESSISRIGKMSERMMTRTVHEPPTIRPKNASRKTGLRPSLSRCQTAVQGDGAWDTGSPI